MGDFRMPSLGADMERGKVVEWLVKPGDYVHRGEIIAAVDTEKTVMEVESFEEGVIAEFLVDLGETVPVGTPIARITGTPAEGAGPSRADAAGRGAATATAPVAAAAAPPPAPAARPTRPEPAATAPAIPQEPTPALVLEPAHLTPPIRRLAHQLGVDLHEVHGTGPDGAITRADVESAAVPAGASAAAAGAPSVGRAGQAESTRPGGEAASGGGGPAHPPDERVRSSPRARRLAAELGVDLAGVRGTGPGGAVAEADVRLAAEAAKSPPPPAAAKRRAHRTHGERQAPGAGATAIVPAAAAPAPASASGAPATSAADAAKRLAGLRRAIGSLMARSKREIPHYYLSTTIDLSAAMAWMRDTNAGRPIASRLVPSALLLAATARAAHDVPDVNGFFVDDAFQQSPAVHLGVAVALRGGGLVAPAIHDADTLSVDALMEQLRDLVARARSGRLQRAEMADPTITVTNLGDLGVESVFGVIYAPQVALVGFGRVVERPWAQDGMLGVRPTVTATLSADHRVSDGLRGGRFLARVDELLQKPEEL
jgi:pyruvate dehydrogenase E2 component (dihydrolipoamide acetyltransferase)